MTPSSLSWTLRHIVPLYRHMAQACLLWTLNSPVPHSTHITDHTPLNQMCNTKIISLHRSTENCRDPARLKIRPLIKLKAWPYTESEIQGGGREWKGSVEWRYGGWLVRTRFISPVARLHAFQIVLPTVTLSYQNILFNIYCRDKLTIYYLYHCRWYLSSFYFDFIEYISF